MSQPLTKEDLNEALVGLATKKDIEAVRSEMAEGFQDVRGEMTKGFQDVRGEMTKGFQAIRNEMATKVELEDLKLNMNARFEDMPTKDDLLALEDKFVKDVDAVVSVQFKETKDLKRRVERLEGIAFPKHA